MLFMAIIDGDDPASRVPQKLDESENIKIHYLPYNDNLMYEVEKLVKENDYTLESKVWTFAVGLALHKLI